MTEQQIEERQWEGKKKRLLKDVKQLRKQLEIPEEEGGLKGLCFVCCGDIDALESDFLSSKPPKAKLSQKPSNKGTTGDLPDLEDNNDVCCAEPGICAEPGTTKKKSETTTTETAETNNSNNNNISSENFWGPWDGVGIFGPKNTPYEGGMFQMEFTFFLEYPFRPPRSRLKTPIYHFNFEEDGTHSFEIESWPHRGCWSPVMGIVDIVKYYVNALKIPRPDDESRIQIADLYKQNREEHDRLAREFTKLHAMKNKLPLLESESRESRTNPQNEKKLDNSSALSSGDVAGGGKEEHN